MPRIKGTTIMKTEEHKNFDNEALQWDKNPGRVKIAADVAQGIIREITLTRDMDVLDFGCGTGLLSLHLLPHVGTVTGVDSSPGMLGVLREKIGTQGLKNVRTLLVDMKGPLRIDGAFHLIVSSMTLHHVPDTAALFRQWHGLLIPGGRLCFADLDAEDGSFHGDNTGVFHFGFDRANVRELLQGAGFHAIRDTTATTVMRDVAGNGKRAFPVFLITASK